MQQKQTEWAWQWEKTYDDNQWLFSEWIYPNTLETFRGKTVLDCGCGGGQHLAFVAPFCSEAVGVDLNAISSAARHTSAFPHVSLIEADIATMNLGRQFDIVYSIGVLHHTDDPTASFKNIVKHCRPGGRVIVWVYSHEGNALNRFLVEPLKRILIHALPRPVVWGIANIFTALVYIPVYTLYLLPLRSLPYFQYFQNWRKLRYKRNLLNVFDKLNAQQTHFLKREIVESWFHPQEFSDIHISPYKGVSFRASGTKSQNGLHPVLESPHAA